MVKFWHFITDIKFLGIWFLTFYSTVGAIFITPVPKAKWFLGGVSNK